MPVTSVFWADNAAQDLHLIPGFAGPWLNQVLWLAHTAGNRRADDLPVGVSVTFAANFVPGPGTAGVTVDADIGEVIVTAAPLPAPNRLLDFIVTATVREGASTFRAWRRFHIHESISRLWLTPGTLTVRRSARNVRFTILAEFADGTYGDLTPWCPWDPPGALDWTYVRRTDSTRPAFEWSRSPAGTVSVHPDTGALTGSAASGSATITASLRPLPAPADRRGTGTARAGQRWSTPVTLSPIDGPVNGVSGFASMGRVANVLILPDGFQDRTSFEGLARELVQRLRTRSRTRPFDLLKDEINYISAWVESREAGVSPLELVRRFNVAGTRGDAEELDHSVPEAAIPGRWLVGRPPTPATNNRYLLNERDTAFHVVLGTRPAAQRQDRVRNARFHDSRFDEQDFDDFLKALRDPSGTARGAVWARGGKDERLILVLARSLRTGGSNVLRRRRTETSADRGRYVAMMLDREDVHRIEDNADGLGKDLRPDAIPTPPSLIAWTRAAHELAHSFDLLDEYGDRGSLPAESVAWVTASYNAEARANLLTGGNLDADKIKWRWPRLRVAGVLASVVSLGGNRFRVELRLGHGTPSTTPGDSFNVGDIVRFRRVPLRNAAPPTDRFIVVSRVADTLEVEALTATVFAPASFPAGSVLLCPVREDDPDLLNRVFGDDRELVHKTVRERINSDRNPLNAVDKDPPNRPCADVDLPTPTQATNFAKGRAPNPPKYPSWLIGLYENAAGFNCDVYRPTGTCLMRNIQYVDAPATADRAFEFCHVCRYALVDLIDPSKHGQIDRYFKPRYPR